jgi:hypothetical protein
MEREGGRVAAGDDEELPKITAAHLRRASTMCARRLAYEHADRRSMRRSSARFRVQNQLFEDARLTHVDMRVPDPAHFRPGDDLTNEEARLYETAARWYVALYQDRPARTVDLGAGDSPDGIDDWATRVADIGVRLVGRCGLAVEHDDGRRGVRLLRIGRGVPNGDVLDDADVRFAVLRLAGWEPSGLEVSIADVLHGARREEVVDAAGISAVREWLADRVAVVRTRIRHGDVTPGIDCASCAFVPGCPAHR